jgi:hypothetical protein
MFKKFTKCDVIIHYISNKQIGCQKKELPVHVDVYLSLYITQMVINAHSIGSILFFYLGL